MAARMLAALCVVLSTASVAASDPIRYMISSADTLPSDDGYGSQVVELDATLDHMTGFVDIHRLVGGPWNIPPHSAQLTKTSSNDYGGDTPHGHISFWPRGAAFQYSWAFWFYPQPGVPMALSIKVPEPSCGLMLGACSLGLLAARRKFGRLPA
jgi:hypothetical protein